MHTRVVVLGLLVPLLIVTACSGDDGGDGDGDDGSIREMLGALPATDVGDVVVYGDLAKAAEIAGVEPPSDTGDEDAMLEYVRAITGGDREGSPVVAVPPSVSAPLGDPMSALAEVDEFTEDVGWNLLQVDRFVEVSSGLRVPLTVLEGRFDQEAIEAATDEAEGGVRVAGDPERSTSLDEETPARPRGESLWLSLDDDRLRITGSPNEMDDVLAADDGGDTLADDEALTAIAEVLDDEDAYAAMLNRDPSSDAAAGLPTNEISPDDLENLCEGNALAETPTAVATGLADDDGPVVLVALLHPDDESAEANAEAVERIVSDGSSIYTRQPWSEQVTIDRITTDGEVVVARLRPVRVFDARLWEELFRSRDGLVASC